MNRLTLDMSSQGPSLFGPNDPPFPPEYLAFVVPQHARCEEATDVDDPLKLFERMAQQLTPGGAVVSTDDPMFIEAKRRLLARKYVEVRDDKWPCTIETKFGPQRLVMFKASEPEPSTPFTPGALRGFE